MWLSQKQIKNLYFFSFFCLYLLIIVITMFFKILFVFLGLIIPCLSLSISTAVIKKQQLKRTQTKAI